MTQLEHIKNTCADVQSYLDETGKDALVLSKQNLFSFVTGGEEHIINGNSDRCNASLVLTKHNKFLVLANAEVGTLNENLFKRAGFELCPYDWGAVPDLNQHIQTIADSDNVASDDESTVYAHWLSRANRLNDYQMTLYRTLAKDAAKALDAFASMAKAGMSEREAHALLQYTLCRQGIQPNVLLVGSDERLLKSRHFLPTDALIQRRLMIIGCFRRNGLVISTTRDIYFEKPLDKEKQAHETLAEICAELVYKSHVDALYSDLYDDYRTVFEKYGLSKEFPEHPVAGLTGYEIRANWISKGSADRMRPRQAYAFNPCINGFKSEDTFIFKSDRPEMLAFDSWPYRTIEFENGSVKRALPLQKI